jgi:hypothetical protein
VSVVALTLTTPGHADTPEKKTPPPSYATGAIVRAATALADGLGTVPAGALVVGSNLTTDLPSTKTQELAARITNLIASRFIDARVSPKPATLPVARGLSAQASALVYVQIELVRGELRVTGELFPTVKNSWARLLNPSQAPRAHAFTTVPIDAEIRSFFAPIVLEHATLHKARHDEADVDAIGCGDLDGDGGLELVMVSRSRVVVGRLRAGHFVVERTQPWAALATRAPVPLRDPLATVLVAPQGHPGKILVGHTDRSAVLLDAALVVQGTLAGLPVPGAEGRYCAIPNAAEGTFDAGWGSCEMSTKSPTLLTWPRHDAAFSLDVVSPTGRAARVSIVREPDGVLQLRRDGETTPLRRADAGAQLALADLDLDGTAEVIITSDADGDDTLSVFSISATGKFTPRLRFPAKDGVRAVGVCPPEENGVPAVVAVVGSEVWLVR